MRGQIRYLICLLLVSSLILSACDTGKSGTYDSEGQVFRKVLSQDINTFDPAQTTDNYTFDILNQVYEGLYRFDKEDKAKPAIAKDFPKKSNGGKTLTIQLRKDAQWSNGDPVTANDFVYAWRRVVDPKTASEYAYILYYLKNGKEINEGKKKPEELGVKAIDSHTLKVELEKPIPYIEELLAFGTYLPVNPKVVKKYGDRFGTTPEKTVFNGPFKSDQWLPEDKILLSKNERYWDKGVVKLDKINIKIIKDSQAGASLYDTGSVDDTVLVSEQIDKYKDNPGLNKHLQSSTYYLKLNQDKVPAFKNKDFRLAIAHAINKKEYVNEVLNNGSVPMDKFTATKTLKSPDGSDYSDGVKSPLTYDPKLAKKHLDRALKALKQKEVTFTLTSNETPSDKVASEYLKNQIQSNLPGVNVKIKSMPGKQRIAEQLSGKYEASLAGWGPDYSDPLTFLNTMTTGNSQNNTGWGDQSYDDMLNAADNRLLRNLNKRDQTLKDAEEKLLNDAPIAPIFQRGETHLTNPQVKGLIYHKIGGETTLKYVHIDKSIDRKSGKKKEQ